MSDFDIMNWVKELKIKHFDGVFNKDSRQWAYNCGIINLDSNNGPGTHWACYVDFFLFLSLWITTTRKYSFYQTIQYFTISKKISVLCVYFCLVFFFFFIKKFQDGNSIYTILYKILDPINPSKMKQFLRTIL